MHTLRRELQVAFSPRAQPVWFRLIKWSLLIVTTLRYRQHAWFRYGIGFAVIGSASLHLFYRWKTQGWRRAWGGWSDLAA
jgi:hypothetical protein